LWSRVLAFPVEPIFSRYSIQKTGIDGSVKKSYFDKLGREIRSDVKGFDGSMIHTDTQYNIKGQTDNISDPYSVGSPLLNSYLYDSYGRVKKLTRPSGRNSTFQYSNSSVTETTDGKTFTKTYSSNGTVSSASDAGGTISYTYYPDGKVKTITAPGGITTNMQYDIAGNQTQLVDPSAGTITYTYDGFGQLKTQLDAKGLTTTINYYPDGRLDAKIQSTEETNTYNYNPNKQLTSIVSNIVTPLSNTVKRRFVYDTKGRVTSSIDSIPGTSRFITGFTYDTYGRLSTVTHPSGIVETKNYNTFGYLSSINAGGALRWTITGVNARQQVTSGKYGSNLNTTFHYSTFGYLDSIGTGTIFSYSYNFDPVSGNLNWRRNNKGSNLTEDFHYDNLNRLDDVYMGTTLILDMAYDGTKGVLTSKTDAGTMLYNTSGKPYAVSNINPATSLTPGNTQDITYTTFNKVSTISENNYNASFTYNSDNQKLKMIVQQGSSHILTRWYPTNSFMKDSTSGSVKLYTYIGGDAYSAPCVAIRQGSSTRYYYLIRDHLGSIIEISDSSNTKLYEYSYDAWGRMRNPSTWANYAPGSEPALFTTRGFTGHEHLPWFNLINMNGRVYDPLIGQFSSPDNFLNANGLSIGYNRYAYCLNNPLKYIDPSGNQEVHGVGPLCPIPGYNTGIFMQDGGGGGGGYSGPDPSSAYVKAVINGYSGSYSDFSKIYDKCYTNNLLNGGDGRNLTITWGQKGYSIEDGKTEVIKDDKGNTVIVSLQGIKIWEISRSITVGGTPAGQGGLWNDPVTRAIVPDFISIGVGFTGIVGTGAGSSAELRWVTRGPEASWKPMVTVTQSVGGGFQVDATLNIEGANYIGNVNNIRRSMMQTSTPNGDFPSIWGAGSLSAGGMIGVTGYITPNVGGSLIIGRQINIGAGLPAGSLPVNGAGGVSNTWILDDFNE
jgi:RHS repeat-associated protein